MSRLQTLLGIIILSLSFQLLAQTASVTTTTTSSTTPNMCVERGLKCCFKARGKRAEKIKAKCEKKYKCVCPANLKVQ